MRQQTPSKRVKFTKQVTSKTTVSTNAPLKSCLKRPPGPRGGSASQKQLFGQQGHGGAYNIPPTQQFSTPQMTAEELAHREQNRHQTRALRKLQVMRDRRRGKKKAERQGRYGVLPILPEGCELGQYNLPPKRRQPQYAVPQRARASQEVMRAALLKPPFVGSPPSPQGDFSRYYKFLENYAPYAGDWSWEVPRTPPCSPNDPGDDDPNDDYDDMLSDYDCAPPPMDECQQYGPPCPMEELLSDQTYYPLAGSMVEGGLMDMMPRVDLPEPLVPTPYEGVQYGPSGHGFHQPLSTARHKMVGWQEDPQVRLYRPDLPSSTPYEPWEMEHLPADDCDMIGLMSPPLPPSPTELKRLRYCPPPSSPPHRPYVGMLGEDPWNIPETMPYPTPRQYSPQRLPRHFGMALPRTPPRPPPPRDYDEPSPVYIDQSPDYDMGEARWFNQMLTGQGTPPNVRQYQPRRVFQEPSYRRRAAGQAGDAADCGRGGIMIRSPEWVPPHLREEESIDMEDTDEWRRKARQKVEDELNRRMQKYGVGKYRKDEYIERLKHCYDPRDRASWAPPMAAGPSHWFDQFNFPTPPPQPQPQPQPICETPKRAPPGSARRSVGPPAARAPSAGRQPPSVCRSGPPGGSGGPPKRRQPPPVPQFKEKLKIDKLPAHLKGKGPTEMTQRNTGPDESEMSAKAQRLSAAKERAAKAKAYAAQQRQATKKC